MRKAIGRTAAIAVLLHAQPIWAKNGDDAWQGTKWGMTRDEIVRLYPQAQDYMLGEGAKASRVFGLKNWLIEGCETSVDFYLGAGGLEKVLISLGDNTRGSWQGTIERNMQCAKIFQKALFAKYGTPMERKRPTDSYSELERVKWQIGDEVISFVPIEAPNFPVVLIVEYARTDAHAGHGL